MGSLPPKQPHPYPFLEQWKNFWASLERPPPLFFNGIPPSLHSSYLKPPLSPSPLSPNIGRGNTSR